LALLLFYPGHIMKQYLDNFNNCLQHEPSFCSAACPFGLDVSTFIARLQEGRFDAAYKVYRDSVGFPFIAAEICHEPCKKVCLKNAVAGGDPIELKYLEKACLAYTKKTEPTNYNLPNKKKSVAIIGAGISGMACALRMATKKYEVTIYEKSNRAGGTLLDLIDPAIVEDDFALQMQFLDYEIIYNTEINSLDDIASQSDAIYVAAGDGGNRFGFDSKPYGMIGETGVFLGGSLLGRKPVDALADGLRIATAIDNFTMTRNLKYPEPFSTGIRIDETVMVHTKAVKTSESLYTGEQTVEEAKRCIQCQCRSCRLHCDLTEYVRKWPLRLRDEILATTAPGRSELHATPAVRLINSCTHCGLCRETCPEDIDLDGLIQAARFRMHRLDKMPWVYNDFFLRDMAFTNGEAAYLCGTPESTSGDTSGKCSYAFYPGCQLGAGEPALVAEAYKYILRHKPDTGIMLGCCGVPAIWAGDGNLHEFQIDRIRSEWERLGKPVMIITCPTCMKIFRQHLPEIRTAFLYDLMAQWGVGEYKDNVCGEIASSVLSVFDPCSTSAEDSVRQSVRAICGQLNLKTEPLPVQEKYTACCSYGGHGHIADPGFTKFVRENRIGESDNPYITYCINCRDSFMNEGKAAPHILNLMFGVEPKLYTWTARRENRILLKKQLGAILMNSETVKTDSSDGIIASGDILLEISPELRQKLSDEYILEQEIADVVAFCERTGRTLYNQETGTLTGYRKIGNMTYWAEYEKTGSRYRLVNAYSHRMEIEIEMIWNGEKVEIHE
jgi:Fe-S oxidoreductase